MTLRALGLSLLSLALSACTSSDGFPLRVVPAAEPFDQCPPGPLAVVEARLGATAIPEDRSLTFGSGVVLRIAETREDGEQLFILDDPATLTRENVVLREAPSGWVGSYSMHRGPSGTGRPTCVIEADLEIAR